MTCVLGATLLACTGESVEPPKTILPPPAAGSGAPVCEGAICSCQPSQERCGGMCANLKSDSNNCGSCGQTCNGGACDNGICACPSTLTACFGSCIDNATDERNCGKCGFSCGDGELCESGLCMKQCTPACTGGKLCVEGVCECPTGRDSCAEMCVDLQATPQHCGMCGKSCIQGQLCQQGQCVCPAGQVTCDAQCVDLQISPQHCGMCGDACDEGEACMAGTCRAPAGADGCTGEPGDLSLAEVAAYQSIKIPLSKGGSAVSESERESSLVQGRLTLFRVGVTTGSGFSPREFSARVTVTNGNDEDQYFAKQRITETSSDDDSASTFQVFVPADRILEGTKYRVEVVECGAGGTTAPPGGAPPPAGGDVTTMPAAGANATHFPATGDAELGAVDTGTLKIKLIPIRANDLVADTDEKALAVYREYILAMYPLAKIEFTVGEEISSGSQVNWNNLIEAIRARRQEERPEPDVYYYGLLRPTRTFEEYCRRGCTAGVGYVGSATQAGTRAALGVGFADEMSSITMAHEVGHNHGRNHAPCANGGSIQGVDRNYPHDGAETGVWGFDSRSKKLLSPTETTDIMGYCDPKWISDYTYNGLFERLVAINSDASPFVIADPEAAAQINQRYNVLLNDPDGARWSQPFPEPGEPHGVPESADVLDLDGQLIDQVTVYRTQIGDSLGSSVLIPEVQPGWHAIKLVDALPLPFSAPIAVPAP